MHDMIMIHRYLLVPAGAHVLSNKGAKRCPTLNELLLFVLFEGPVLSLFLNAFDDNGGYNGQEHVEVFGLHGGHDTAMQTADFLQEYNVVFYCFAFFLVAFLLAEYRYPLRERLNASFSSSPHL